MRRRRTGFWTAALVFGILALIVGTVGVLLKIEPAFYAREFAIGPQASDPEVASNTQTRLVELGDAILRPQSSASVWSFAFRDPELNAFLREDSENALLLRSFLAGLIEPRLSLDGDRLLFGTRTGRGFWSAVLSVELKVWLIPTEPNQFAVEVVSCRAGSLPLPKRSLMDRFSEFAAANNSELVWFQRAGNPVGVCRLKITQSQPDMKLESLSLEAGQLTISGKSLGSGP